MDFKPLQKLDFTVAGLKIYEKVSTIFLLCKKPDNGLKTIELILNTSDVDLQNHFFREWMCQHKIFHNNKWSDEFIEAVTILQNYKITKTLGYKKDNLIKKYAPLSNLESVHIPLIKKLLYNLCEELTLSEFIAVVHFIEPHNKEKLSNKVLNKYLECKLLQWSIKNIISLGNEKEVELSVLLKAVKPLYLKNFETAIDIVTQKSKNEFLKKSLPLYYDIYNENCLGICAIINEKNFKGSNLTTRNGTERDVERLEEVFTAFGFKVVIHNDVPFYQFMEVLDDIAESIDSQHSFFILIILSHGSENVIYASDSQPITMNSIEMKFQAESCPILLGKPKIFIIQSCQGDEWQNAQYQLRSLESLNIQKDAAHTTLLNQNVEVIGPQRGDSIIAWSTVQGYASFRDQFNGSWYIEELCKQLWRFGSTYDLVDIFTQINNNLRNKIYNGQFMVPFLSSTLRGKVKFPFATTNQQKGRKMMLERLIFEKYFQEFLTEKKEL